MKNKGFTLIELLAVIVILAIIALIATPVILNIINDTRESSNKRSMEFYARAVQNAVAHYMMLHPEDTEVTFDDIEEYIDYDGAEVSCADRTIKEDGSVALDNCTINGKAGYSYGVKTPACTLSEEEYTLEDYYNPTSPIITETVEVVTCGSEQFYVISKDSTTIKALAKYNLGLSASPYLQDTTGAINRIDFWESSPEVWPENGSDAYTNTDNLIKPYVNTYKDYLVNTVGMSGINARLMTLDEARTFGFKEDGYYKTSNTLYSPYYYLGTFNYYDEYYSSFWTIQYGFLYNGGAPFDDNGGQTSGIRPLIEIPVSLVQM